MFRFKAPLAAAAVLLFAAPHAAYAESLLSPTQAGNWTNVLSEARLGISAHAAYHTFLPLTLPTKYDYSQINDLTLDLLFRSPDFFSYIGSPRPNFGGTLNLAGKESMVHLGVTWQAHVFDLPLYVEGTFGAAINNGYLHHAPPGFHNMGCHLQFYEVFAVGADIADNVTATVTYEHTSNANLCSANQGLSNFGIRIGYKF